MLVTFFARDFVTACEITGIGGGRNGGDHCKSADVSRVVGAGMPRRGGQGSPADSPSGKPASEA